MAETTPQAPLDISLLENLTAGAAASEPPSESAESRIDQVSGLVAKGAYPEAARIAEGLFAEGVRDVRLVGPYLMGAFLERGLEAMPVIFASLAKFLTTHWESFGPPDKRSIHAQSGLRWLFKTLNKHFEYHARAKDEDWRRWNEPSNRQPLEDALTLVDEVMEALAHALPDSGCEALLTPLITNLSNHLQTLPQAPPPVASAPARESAPEHPESDDHGDEEEDSPPQAQPRAMRSAQAPEPPKAAGPSVPVSPALALLMQKLDAFDALVERRDLARASVVAADLLHTLDHFDPRVYLPTLFTHFFGGLSAHADVIERLLQSTDSLAFRALEQLYRVDLDAFLAQGAETPEE